MPKIYSGRNCNATPQWVRDAGKPWRAPRLSEDGKPFDPKPFEPGDVIRFRHDGRVLTGQVWSHHFAVKTRWVVAEGNAYAVHERDLIESVPQDALFG